MWWTRAPWFVLAMIGAPAVALAQQGDDGASEREAPPDPPARGGASPPRLLEYVPPAYPPAAQREGREASVGLELDIDSEGKVTRATVIDSAGHGFDEAAREAALRLRFAPATKTDGTPSPSRIQYRYTFSLAKEAVVPSDPGEPADAATIFDGTVLAIPGEIGLAGASVTLIGGAGELVATTTTGPDGVFSFDALPAGRYSVRIEAGGYQPLTMAEELDPSSPLTVRYRLVTAGEGLEVVVRGDRPPREVVRRTLEQREINRIPGTNGDALRSLQNLPGVARPPAFAGLLVVRGSAPQDTQTFVDGTPVPLIYHFGGLSSVIPTEAIDDIDFYPGNFGAQYGRVQGGIVDVGLRSPKDDGYHGLAQVDFIDVRALLEGPIPWVDGWSFMVAGRRSWIDALLGPALDAAGAGVTTAPVYYDYQAAIEHQPSTLSRLRLAFFGSDDRLELIVPPNRSQPALSGNLGLATSFQRVQVLYENDEVGSSDTRVSAVAALGRDDVELGLGPLFFLLEVFSVSGRAEVSHRFSKRATLHTGVDLFGGVSAVSLRAPPLGGGQGTPFSARPFQNLTFDQGFFYPAAYTELAITPHPRARIVPGIRVDYYDLIDRVDLSPRVNGRYDIVQGFPRTTAKAGVGLYQAPPQFQQVIEPIGNPNLRTNSAIHYGLGMEQEITRQLEVSLEGFYKQLDRQVDSEPTADGSGSSYDNATFGYAVGSELLIRYKPDERFFGWLAYTLSRSAFSDRPDEPERLINFDQTHILTVLGSYRLGHGWELGARFRLVSGNLTTPLVCDPTAETCNLQRTNSLFYAPTASYIGIPLAGPEDRERLPLFHALDLRLDKRWKFKSWQLSMYLDVQNVYNHSNVEGISYNFDYTARQPVTGLPLLPSFGLRADF